MDAMALPLITRLQKLKVRRLAGGSRSACVRDLLLREVYAGGMRYADGGGLTRGRAARERVRLQAAEMFEQQLPTAKIAVRLRVSTKSVCAWRRA